MAAASWRPGTGPPEPSLFERPVTPPAFRGGTLDERFAAFHRDHPAVYHELVALARRARAAGHRRYSVKALMELVRWHRTVERADGAPTAPGEPFKINNSYASRYARLIEARERDLAGFFEKRTLTS